MGFKASTLQALDYDFTGYPGSEGQPWAVSGTVSEPTAARRDAFAAEMAGILELGPGTPEQLMAAAATIPLERQQDMMAANRQALGRLCAGSPSIEVIEALPARLLDAFRDWLIGELFPRPTMPPAATNVSLAAPSNGASPTPSGAISA